MRNPVTQTIASARENLNHHRIDGRSWNFCAYLGPHYIGQYILLADWMGIPTPRLEMDRWIAELAREQLPNGSWPTVRDPADSSGDWNATLLSYAGLKARGMASHPMAVASKKFLIESGGLSEASYFSKIVLALHGNWSWQRLYPIPYRFITGRSMIHSDHLGQWVGPHILPFAYLAHTRATKHLGPQYDLSELASGPGFLRHTLGENRKPTKKKDGPVIEKVFEEQRLAGSWGAYTHSTLFSLCTLEHYSEAFPEVKARYESSRKRALEFVEEMYFASPTNAYRGVTCDGHHWDTSLSALALLESHTKADKGGDLSPVIEFVDQTQQSSGGVSFGKDFEQHPDVDDTAIAIQVWHQSLSEQNGEARSARMERACQWLLARQASNGGWAAFQERGTLGNILAPLINLVSDSAEMFDYACSDCTGNVLEALATQGLGISNSQAVRSAVAFLKKNQTQGGYWIGRWAVNTLFGTFHAICGLCAAGEPIESAAIQKGLDWLVSVQNPDGGWGESTLSYRDPVWSVKGISTPSQTAWALLALMSGKRGKSEPVRRGIEFLVRDFEKNGEWTDASVVGTGHPGVVYLQYPSYAKIFPLLALGRWLKDQS